MKTLGGVAAIGGTWLIERVSNDWFDSTLYMPAFKLTPEEIFSNEIWMFDINFFEDETEKTYTVVSTEQKYEKRVVEFENELYKNLWRESDGNYVDEENVLRYIDGYEDGLQIRDFRNNKNHVPSMIHLIDAINSCEEFPYKIEDDWDIDNYFVPEDYNAYPASGCILIYRDDNIDGFDPVNGFSPEINACYAIASGSDLSQVWVFYGQEAYGGYWQEDDTYKTGVWDDLAGSGGLGNSSIRRKTKKLSK